MEVSILKTFTLTRFTKKQKNNNFTVTTLMAKRKTYNPTNPNPLGNTTIPPPVKPVVDDETTKEELPIEKKDTLQPVKVPCNDSAIARGKYADSIWQHLDTTSYDKVRLKDSAKNGKFESAFQIYKDSVGNFTTGYFITGNSSQQVTLPYTRPLKTVIGGVHCHIDTEGIVTQVHLIFTNYW
jgi:hypothetical protein